MDFHPNPLTALPTLLPSTLLFLTLFAVCWQLRRHFEKRLFLLRRQFDAQRAATSEFLQHANSQIGLLQSELALARRREDILRARQANKAHGHASPRNKSDGASRILLSVLREQPVVTSRKRSETAPAGCADKMHESPMLPAQGRSNITTRAQAA